LAGFAYRFRLKRQLYLDALYQFLDLTVFAVQRALLLMCGLVCHAHSLPQPGRHGYLWISKLHHYPGRPKHHSANEVVSARKGNSDSDIVREAIFNSLVQGLTATEPLSQEKLDALPLAL
jgi:hypothetical protein